MRVMKTWRAFGVLLVVSAGLVSLAVFQRHGDDFLETLFLLSALYIAGCLPWLLTRSRFWGPSGSDIRLIEQSDINVPVARWYKNAMICAFVYGGLVFGCSVDHNAMGESCAPSAHGFNWWSFGNEPCSLTPTAFFDLAAGVGLGLALLQFPIVIYGLAATPFSSSNVQIE
jgi:hypothetical protein